LLRNLVLQVLLVIAAALAIAIPLTGFALSAASSDGFAAKTEPSVLLVTSALIVVLGVAASVGAMRRVAKIDPAAATARMAGGGLA
jgi:putative ABC transport system permease protein